jgi:hypothetical protein
MSERVCARTGRKTAPVVGTSQLVAPGLIAAFRRGMPLSASWGFLR